MRSLECKDNKNGVLQKRDLGGRLLVATCYYQDGRRLKKNTAKTQHSTSAQSSSDSMSFKITR